MAGMDAASWVSWATNVISVWCTVSLVMAKTVISIVGLAWQGRPSWVLPACWQPPLYAVGWTGDGSWSASLWESWASLVVHRVCLGAVSAFGETGFLCGLAFLGEIGIGGNRCQFHPGPEPLASMALGDGVASPEVLHLDFHVTDH